MNGNFSRWQTWLVLLLLFSAGVSLASAQSRVRVAITAAYSPRTASGGYLRIDLGGGASVLQGERRASGIPTRELGWIELDEGGGAAVVHLDGSNIASGRVTFYLRDRWTDYLLMVDGQQTNHVSLSSPHDQTKSVTVSVINRARMKSQLGSSTSQGAVLGMSSSPYFEPRSSSPSNAIAGGFAVDINLGLTRNGQTLPPLKVRWGHGGDFVLPDHPDIVGDLANIATQYPKKYWLPQAVLTIDALIGTRHELPPKYVTPTEPTTVTFTLAPPDDETHQFVRYTCEWNPVGPSLLWKREFFEKNGVGTSVLVRTEVSAPSQSGIEDWHKEGEPVLRRLHVTYGVDADKVTISDGDGNVSARTRIEYQWWNVEEMDYRDPDQPVTHTRNYFAPLRFVHGADSETPVATERLLLTNLESRGIKNADGSVEQHIPHGFPAGSTGEPNTIRRTVSTWRNASPGQFYLVSDDIPDAYRVTEYEYAQDWNGLKTLPSRIVTTAEEKTLREETIQYQINISTLAPGLAQAQKVIAATRTMYSAPTGTAGRQTLTQVSKKFQPNTPSFFLSDLFYSLEETDGTKKSFAYERGLTALDGAFTPVLEPDADNDPSRINGVRTITVRGLRSTDPAAQPLTSPTFPGVSFDPVKLETGKSTATVEIRRYGLPLITETWICSDAANATFERIGWERFKYTPYGALAERTTSQGTIYTAQWSGFRKDYEIDETGQRIDYAYDAMGRVESITREAVGPVLAQRTAFKYDGEHRVIELARGPENGARLITTYGYDLTGRLTHVARPDGTTEDYNYLDGGRRVEITSNKNTSAEAIVVSERYADGRPLKVTGSAVVPEYRAYDFEGSLLRTTAYSGSENGTTNASRYFTALSDLLGRTVEQRSPSRPGSGDPLLRKYTFNADGRLERVRALERAGTDERSVAADTRFAYDGFGQVTASGLDLGGDLTPASSDRLVNSSTEFVKLGADWWAKSSVTTYEQNNSATSITATVYARLTGLGAGLVAETQSEDARGNVTTTRVYLNATSKLRTEVTQLPDGSALYRDYASGFLVAERSYASGVIPTSTNYAARSTQAYDELGRFVGSTDARGIVTTISYDSAKKSLPWKVFSGLDENGQPVRVGLYTYDEAGRVKSFTNAGNHVIYYAYNPRGQLIRQWGDGTMPLAQAYNLYGERIALRTFRNPTQNFKGETWPLADDGPDPRNPDPAFWGTNGDITRWTYDSASGLLTKKKDAAENATDYAYAYDFVAGQKIVTRTLARTLTNSSTRVAITAKFKLTTGDLERVDYNDNATPAVAYTYTRTGQVETVTDVTGQRRFTYDRGQLLAEFLPAYFGSRVLTTLYQTATNATSHTVAGRYRGFQLGFAAGATLGDAAEMSVTFGHDVLGRIESLAAAYPGYSTSLSYAYTGGTAHWEKLTHGSYQFKRELDPNRDLLASVSARFGGDAAAPIVAVNYKHDARGLIKSAKQSGKAFEDYGDVTFVKYTNDERGQLTDASHYLGADVADITKPNLNKPLHGRSFAFGYDSAGNRETVAVDAETAPYKDGADYTGNDGANRLNQVVSRKTLKTHASGTVATTTQAVPTVTVNGAATSRQGAYWDVALNSFGQTGGIDVSATLGNQTQTANVAAGVIFRPASETFVYDADGNLKSDSVWSYTWDAENRLVQMTTQSWVSPAKTLSFTYDYLGRRVRKVVQSAGATVLDRKFVYNGWNLIAEYSGGSGTLVLQRSQVWGLDVTGSLHASGGVGALALTVTRNGDVFNVREVAYDGNGNVVALVNPSNGTVTAAYEYSPFGELLRATGTEAATNPFRYSTKYCDAETGLYYYGYRYYDASLGRFINRDPLEEAGGVNLYAFISNNPANGWDYLGMAEEGTPPPSDVSIPDEKLNELLNPNRPFGDSQIGDSGPHVVGGASTEQLQRNNPNSEIDARFRDPDSAGIFGQPRMVTSTITGRTHPEGTHPGHLGDPVFAGQVARASIIIASIAIPGGGVALLVRTAVGRVIVYVVGVGQFVSNPDDPLNAIGVLPGGTAARLTPAAFGLKTIAQDAKLLAIWNTAMREASIARRSNGYQRYLQAMERGEKVSPEALREAFDAVNSRFLKAAREAGYDISQVHHWNYNVGNFADQVLDARHLVPTASRGVHEAIHRATSSNPSNIWQGPISEEHIIQIIEQSTVIR